MGRFLDVFQVEIQPETQKTNASFDSEYHGNFVVGPSGI